MAKKVFTTESLTTLIDEIKAHVANAVSGKSNTGHNHDDRYYTETEVDTQISNVNKSITNIVNGTTTVKKAESATTASTASNAEKLGNQLPSYYATASAIPTGALANKDTVSASDLDSNLAEKVNAAVQGNHSHSNKSVLDGITSTKVSAWDSAESNANTYTDQQISSHSHGVATTTKDGFMSTDMVKKLSGIAAGAQVNTITGVKGNSESSYRTGQVNITKANIGLGNVDNTSDANKPVSTAQQTAIDTSLASAKSYTDEKIDAIVGEGASTTLDTIGEISAAITENQGMLTTLNNAIGNKVDKVSGKGLSTNDLTATLKSNYDTAYSHVSNKNNPHGVTLSQLGVSATADELNYVDGVTSNIQTQLNGKQASISGGASTIASSDLTASRALVSNSSGKVAVSAVTSTELGYLDGVTSAIQTQLDAKAPTGHGHDNATTTTAGFMSASDKTKLNGISEGADSVSFAQSLTSGAEVGTITINGSGTKLYAPANTNTTYDLTTTQASGQNVKLNLVAGGSGTGTDSIEIKGGGATNVYRDTNSGAIVIESTDNDTTYGAAGSSLGLVKSGGDVTISNGTITVNDDSHNHVISNIDNLQAALDEKSDSGHTHNYAGSSTAGGAATSANKVNSSLTIKLNSGTTEGTNMFTFNGSGDKAINITPSAIGASESSHTHDGYLASSNPTGTGSLSLNRKSGTNAPEYSVAVGYNNTATGRAAFAEGEGTTASSQSAHAEGYNTTASSYYAHAEGNGTTASNRAAHAEGNGTVAKGQQSHAEGFQTIAASTNQHVQGKYNIEDADGAYAHIVGNGSSTARSNAHTLDWDGNAWFAGDVYVGGTSQDGGTALAKSTDLTSHTSNQSNPHGVTASQVGAYTKTEIDTTVSSLQTAINGKASSSHTHDDRYYTESEINSKIDTLNSAINKKADDYSLEIYNGTGGNPKPVKFLTVNYSTCGSENGVAIKLGLVSGHGNGSSYAFLEDAIIKVTHTGSVSVDNFKYYGASTGSYDGANRYYGDIFWTIDTTNKIVDFYCLMGQYARVQMTPYKRVTYSTGGTITQHTSCTVYSSGTKVWANNNEFAMMNDLDSLDARLTALETSIISVHSGTEAPLSDIGEDNDLYLVV